MVLKFETNYNPMAMGQFCSFAHALVLDTFPMPNSSKNQESRIRHDLRGTTESTVEPLQTVGEIECRDPRIDALLKRLPYFIQLTAAQWFAENHGRFCPAVDDASIRKIQVVCI